MQQVVWITTNETIFMKSSFIVSSQISSILVTRFLRSELQKFSKKILAVRSKTATGRKRWKNNRMVIAKLFAIQANAKRKITATAKHFGLHTNAKTKTMAIAKLFCVTPKCNKVLLKNCRNTEYFLVHLSPYLAYFWRHLVICN